MGAKQRRRPAQNRSKATREHILDAAATVFAEHGIENSSTNRIAEAAQVSIGTLYRYFTGKDEIFDELLDRLLQDVEDRFSHRMPTLSKAAAEDPSMALTTAVMTELLTTFTDVLVANGALVRGFVGKVPFYDSGLPELEPRLRFLVKLLLIQVLGPGVDHAFDHMALVVLNTGFAAVLRVTTADFDDDERDQLIALTAEMMAAWLHHRLESA